MLRTALLRRVLPATGSAALLLTLSACGGSGTSTSSSSGEAQSGTSQGGTSQGGPGQDGPGQDGPGQDGPGWGMGGRGFPGASGTIAAVSGKTMQVQNQQTGQVAVTFTSKTTFSKQISATRSDLKVGDCVVAVAPRSDASTGSSDTTVAATSVGISQPTKGSCAVGFGGGFGGWAGGPRPSGVPSGVPSGAPSGAPGGAHDGGRYGGPGSGFGGGFGGGAFGQVTAVSASGFTVKATRPGSASPSPSPSPSTFPSTVTVTVSDSTTWTSTAKATAAAVKVGQCATAQGKTDDTGAVTASRISLSSPVDGHCGTGFGRMAGSEQKS